MVAILFKEKNKGIVFTNMPLSTPTMRRRSFWNTQTSPPEKITSKLCQKPGKVEVIEPSRNGLFPDAGFTIMLSGKSQEKS